MELQLEIAPKLIAVSTGYLGSIIKENGKTKHSFMFYSYKLPVYFKNGGNPRNWDTCPKTIREAVLNQAVSLNWLQKRG